jgi:hypothetical protein
MAAAELYRKTGRISDAERYAGEALKLATKLNKHDPENAMWQKWLARIEAIAVP